MGQLFGRGKKRTSPPRTPTSPGSPDLSLWTPRHEHYTTTAASSEAGESRTSIDCEELAEETRRRVKTKHPPSRRRLFWPEEQPEPRTTPRAPRPLTRTRRDPSLPQAWTFRHDSAEPFPTNENRGQGPRSSSARPLTRRDRACALPRSGPALPDLKGLAGPGRWTSQDGERRNPPRQARNELVTGYDVRRNRLAVYDPTPEQSTTSTDEDRRGQRQRRRHRKNRRKSRRDQ